ncbi:MAG: IS1634 family transposase [Rickettsiales bacterium]|nr:IS1634 family transposase [Rickettsiales bacterium]
MSTYKVRTIKTTSGAAAVQVVEYFNNKRNVVFHLGSASNQEDLERLKDAALKWIDKNDPQGSLFPLSKRQDAGSVAVFDKCEYLGFKYQLLYDILWNLAVKFKFHLLADSKILNDLVIARLVHPCSKAETFEFISDFFGINHSRRDFYRTLSNLLPLKDEVERKAIYVAKKYFDFSFNIVFYDLTTLYFESFETDELRRIGFSKDNKASNPQIMIGLLVNNSGFPVSYQVFPGNKFEGNTIEPAIVSLKKKYKIKQLTIVADSAMISEKNITLLKNNNLDYIVGARMANLQLPTIQRISQDLKQEDNKTVRITIEGKDDLVCHFSQKRYNKDKRELEKQIERAEEILKTPSKAEIIKRAKFLIRSGSKNDQNKEERKFELNQKLVVKAKLLLGIKGYFTSHKTTSSNKNNSKNNNIEIVNKYKQLWNVERSFKISKSDLKARPIFHNKEQAIKTHILICFMALAIAKYIEIKTHKSIKSVIKELKRVTDARIYDKINKREFVMRSKMNDEVKKILEMI